MLRAEELEKRKGKEIENVIHCGWLQGERRKGEEK